MVEKSICVLGGIVACGLLGSALWTSPHWIGPKVRELCGIAWPIGAMVAPGCLFVSYITKSKDAEESAKWARAAAWILLVCFLALIFGTTNLSESSIDNDADSQAGAP